MGGLAQLVAYGSQDKYLTQNPQITFFKAVYRRHTNYSVESISQTLSGTKDFGGEMRSILSKAGDLACKMYLEVTLPEIDLSTNLQVSGASNYSVAFRWLNWIGHILIDEIKIKIGGQEIDKHTGEWLHIWNELTQTSEKAEAYAEMVGNVPKLTQIYSSNSNSTTTPCKVDAYTLYIPLQFWFNRSQAGALPIIALQNSDVEISITFKSLDSCMWGHMVQLDSSDTTVTDDYDVAQGSNIFSSSSGFSSSTTPSISSVKLYVDYIFLDTHERRRFAEVAHEYLIEKVQIKINKDIASGTTQQSISLNSLSHPVKEIIWVTRANKFVDKSFTQTRGGHQYYNFTDAFDYSGFTGTPENYWGPGLRGGRAPQNIFYGASTVKIRGELNEDNSTNNFLGGVESTSVAFNDANATVNKDATGYADVMQYTPVSGINKTENRYMEHLLGPALSQPVLASENRVGLWSATNNNLKLFNAGKNPTTTAKITLNGTDRFSARGGDYFNLWMPHHHHTNNPAPGINVYSFAENPENHQPSGTCNFSRIDDSNLEITALSTNIQNYTSNVRVYAFSYNILRIMGGMGGLAYSS